MVLRAADALLRRPPVKAAGLRLAARRRRGIALVWHRIGPRGSAVDEVVPTLSTGAFTAQLDVLCDLGEIVPLSEIEDPLPTTRPRFALTFDDDNAGHTQVTLPLLLERGLPATFFLSGRWRLGYGPYWWEVLEERIRERGGDEVAREYGLPAGTSAQQIARAIQGTEAADQLAAVGREMAAVGTMVRQDAEALVAAGMEIGFHTIDHPVLPRLGDEAVRTAVHRGREELSQELGVPVRRFAYPHGRADRRVAGHVAAAGYVSAWTTRRRAAVPATTAGIPERFLQGRYDAGHLPAPVLRAALLRGLVRP